MDLENRKIYVIMRLGTALKADGSRWDFVHHQWDVDLPDDYGQDLKLRPRAMTCPEIVQRRRETEARQGIRAAGLHEGCPAGGGQLKPDCQN